MSYGIAARVFIDAPGNPITALAVVSGQPVVTGGVELTGIRGNRVRVRWGMRIEVQKDEENYSTVVVTDREQYPHCIIPFSGASKTDLDKVLEPFRDGSNFKLSLAVLEGLVQLPAGQVLIIPDDPSLDDFIYLPQASLGPESSDLINFDEVDPLMIEAVEFVPNAPLQIAKPMTQGTLAQIAALISAENASL